MARNAVNAEIISGGTETESVNQHNARQLVNVARCSEVSESLEAAKKGLATLEELYRIRHSPSN